MSEVYPSSLFEGLEMEDEIGRNARIGRFVVLQEMGFFGEETNIDLSKAQGKGSWMHQVRKRFSGTYGDVKGCHPADIEVAAEMRGVFDDIFDAEIYNPNSRYIQDK
jgi:hypothetical protein